MRKSTVFFSLVFSVSIVVVPWLFSAQRTNHAVIPFIKGMFKNPKIVGALAPSSPYVAEEMTRMIAPTQKGKNILEIGAGTGQITETIIKKMNSNDHLDVIELNEEYCEVLHARFGALPNVQIFCGSILDWQPAYRYSAIVCTLPFNRFDSELVTKILDHSKNLTQPNGHFSFIELKYLSAFKRLVLSAKERDEQEGVCKIMNKFKSAHCKEEATVYRNIPPVQVFHCILM